MYFVPVPLPASRTATSEHASAPNLYLPVEDTVLGDSSVNGSRTESRVVDEPSNLRVRK
jgi:hypothetical protein